MIMMYVCYVYFSHKARYITIFPLQYVLTTGSVIYRQGGIQSTEFDAVMREALRLIVDAK